jgi:anti-sigma regulatory factor (Ser/Thr protein kinase)
MDDPARQQHSLTLESGRAASGKASEWASALAARAGLSDERVYALDLCIVEIVSNIVDHGYRGGPGRIWIDLDLSPAAAVLTFQDQAPAFDPLSVPAPILAASIEEAQVGGFGVHLVRSSSDGCHYERRNGRNVFTVRFALKI